MRRETIGLDVGGAHLKLARLGGEGALVAVRIAPCPLWRGLDQLASALDAVAEDLPKSAAVAVTMTGELVDLWPDRAAGVTAIAAALVDRFGAARTAFYAGGRFVPPADVRNEATAIASANWRATAEAVAADGAAALLLDVGSTTSDLVPVAGGAVLARAATDAERLVHGELVYLGVARTPVMAIARRAPFGGAWIAPMAELFATSADVHRLTGDLPEDADLHPAADGGPKTAPESARRLLRMVGADLDAAGQDAAVALARHFSEIQLRTLCDATSVLLSRPEATSITTIVGAGVGRFLAKRVAERLGLGYRDLGALLTRDPALQGPAADCAPAVAVARLFAGNPARLP